MAAVLKSQYCANHPDRPGRALCMACKKVVCQECATQWEGINYCVHCLRRKRARATERGALWPWLCLCGSSGVLLLLTVKLMVWVASVLAEI